MTHLGVPETIDTCLFDLDGVITKTAAMHEAAWRETFDPFLRRRLGADFRPFDLYAFNAYVDGRPRTEGVRSFLASRDIVIPEGLPDDSAQQDTVNGLGRRKNELLLEKIRSEGVEPYPTTLHYIEEVRRLGLRTAVVSSSANCREVLRSIGAEELFDVRVDGLVAAERGLPGKPRPDTFLAAAHDLGSTAEASAVFEDALAGIDAARAGRFGFTIGVDRAGQGDVMRAHGADVVVRDISELVDRE
ncbi:HAD family hydrolase [Streptomyces sp. NPDC089424]|uniref:HAD family hydrolase n=1 Tax=Streptomyces sp. NPDC089424 TaxID=3365917 RepID=UPI003809A429